MASSFPGTLDSFATNRADATPMTVTHAADHNNYADAINTLERTFGPDVFSVLNYGAVGNGSTDDTAAIQETIDAAEAYTIASQRGATVYFPAGQYRTSAPLRVTRDNIVLEGYARAGTGRAAIGAESTTPVTGGSIIMPLSSFAGSWVIDVSFDTASVRALVGCWIKNLALDCWYVPAGATGGIFFQVFRGGILYCDVARLSSNTVATGPGIKFQCVDDTTVWPKGAWDCVFDGNVIQDCVAPCFYAPAQASDSMISNNIIQGSQAAGLDLNGPGFIVTGNYITGNAPGVLSEGRENYFVGNRFRECEGGIKVAVGGATYGNDFLIVGNAFRNCSEGGDGVNDCIEISPTTAQTGGIISGNHFSTLGSTSSSRPRYGINITTALASDVTVGPNSAGYVTGGGTAYTSPFGSGGGPLNDLGTNTRILSGHKIRVRNTDGTQTDITAETTATTSTALLQALGKRADGTVIPVKVEAGSDGRVRIGSTANIPIDLIQNNLAKLTFNTSGDVAVSEAVDFALGTTTGSMLGTAAAQKLGFWGATPAIKPTAVTDATGGATIDAEARTALNALLARLRTIGIITT